jgi:hypothetical protein
MKKFLIVFVVLAMVCLSSMAFAADVSVGGGLQVRSRNFQALNFDKDNGVSQVDTQTRVEVDINAKISDDVKGKIALWNDWNEWGTLEANVNTNNTIAGGVGFVPQTVDTFGFREAWINFNLPGIPVNVTAGHQLLALGQGWFFRSKHFGSDAWVVANVTGNNTAAFVDVKALEGSVGSSNDDIDAYVLLDVYKINDNNVIGIDITDVNAREAFTPAGLNGGHFELQNISLNYTGKLGPVALKAQADAQMGKIDSTTNAAGATVSDESKFKGYELVVQGNVGLEAATINFTAAYGTGNKVGDKDIKEYVNLLDTDPHYTFLYEYKTITACVAPDGSTLSHTGFCNTMALSVGASAALSKSVKVGLDYWYLQAAEKEGTPLAYATNGAETSSDIGSEIDLTFNWKLYDNLTWNWTAGYFKPGDALKTSSTAKTDAVMGIQGILALNF